MRKLVVVPLILSFFVVGCSQQNPTPPWNPDQLRVFLPEVHDLSSVVTQQALVNQTADVKKAVNVVASSVYDTLSGQLNLDASQIDGIVAAAISKSGLTPQLQAIVQPIVSSVLLVGFQSIEGKLNAAGQSLAANNALVIDFVKAADSGIRDGSAVVNLKVKGKFLLAPPK